jgi:RNA polymerase sigma-32 factor
MTFANAKMDPKTPQDESSAATAPYLTRDEEYRLWTAFARDADESALQLLVLSNMRYVIAIAMKYRSYALPLRELVHHGHLGLLYALRNFEPERGCRLLTYAAYCIRASILDSVLCSWHKLDSAKRSQPTAYFRLRRDRARMRMLTGEVAV